jgi:hypothetical protein
MTRIMLGMCAGAWALLLAGCASTDVAAVIGLKADGNERVVDGSLDLVAQSTKDRLGKLGLKAEVNKNGEAFYIDSAFNGARFTLVLTGEKTGQTEQTRIKLQWLDKANGDMARLILVRLEDVAVR